MEEKITIDRFEDDKAVLKTSDNKTIIWPTKKLPENIKEGDVLLFTIQTENEKTIRNKELAKTILNEILNPTE
ncbi:DUF3006 domain-containing protein [Candidatus Parcubacteria bacterium]|nr:DUF3006 domain-containing protein [Patescibacteria group bacterium]MBU4309763.1 DUF3006 domain-containing protein [Patescibacteria group bacterium]MBU4431769.1 DUF3006 domain-containing protein [Patescibacteria group bacterium]MBU4578102.1 DUF3006 domain-containing protein [Patescibacteria group bacterium]MCG2696639.1 DUF3006 domain-containing protein [Candidatus Parcubacteria bacterium]